MAENSNPALDNPLFQEVTDWLEAEKEKPDTFTLEDFFDTIRYPYGKIAHELREENTTLTKELQEKTALLENSTLEGMMKRLEEVTKPLVSSYMEGNEKMQKIRVEVSRNADGTANYKWACGKNQQQINDSIVRLYIENGLLSEEQLASMAMMAALPTRRIKFGEYADQQRATYHQDNVKGTTQRSYSSPFKSHILPAFGNKYIDEITPDDIQKFLNDRKGLSNSYLKEILRLLNLILNNAVSDEYIPKNPASAKRIVAKGRRAETRNSLTRKQVFEILGQLAALPTVQRRYMALIMLAGLRRGEALGLRWIDIDEHLLRIRGQITYEKNQPYYDDMTKTINGMREIPMIPQLWELLQPIEHVGYVVTGEEAISLMRFRRMYEKVAKEINLYGSTSHVFRHTFASFARNKAKVEKSIVKSVLGHSDERTTERYTHTDDDDLQEAREAIAMAFTPPKEV